jgi:streptomycin 3"-kinase
MMPLAREVVGEGRVQPDFLPQDLLDTPPATILERLQEELPLRLAQEQADAVVCHGDLTLPNVLVDPGTARVTGLVDLGRLGRADPYADLALLLATARETWGDDGDRRAAAVLGERYGIEPDPDRLRFHLWLDPLTW